MNKYSGIDLHSNNCVVAVIDDDDHVCCQKRLPNDLAKIVSFLEPHREALEGVDKFLGSTMACSLGCDEACHGNETAN